MQKHRNSIEFTISGRYALFSEATTRVGGEKFSYQVPTYQALKGMVESIYWKPTIIWIIDAVRVMNRVQTESKGIRPIKYIKYNGGNDLSYYTYLKDVKYQIRAHFEWNNQRPELAGDRDENKHHQIALRSVEKGGRRDVFLGTRECQGYVEPCVFGEEPGFYDSYGEWNLGYMFHSFSYPDENADQDFLARFWTPVMKDGIIEFPRTDSQQLDSGVIRSHEKIKAKEFTIGKNMHLVGEDEK